ncbi:spore coat protein [Caldisalinibacter kiritimatiensis]|uniref:spore coat protein n=1 Tax=Caldisalinibacter kiritimatiensis TaxID=1304284 RepID=UPI0005518252|nr:spore coat protein [Caldisalinibacter kiritimatiensis]
MVFNKYLTERELLSDLMTSEKELSNLYNDALTKSCSPLLKQTLSQCFFNTLDIQSSIHHANNIRGWNNARKTTEKDISNIVRHFKYKKYY